MAFQIPVRAKMAANSASGTGTLTLSTAADASLRSFQTAVGGGPVVVEYQISGNGVYEQGVGTFTAPSTLTRTTVKASSNGGALVNLASANYDVALVWHPGSAAVDSFSGTKNQALSDNGSNQLFTGSGASNYNLLARSVIPFGFEQFLDNGGTANLTVVRNGSDTINGAAANVVLPAGTTAVLYPIGTTDWRLVGISYSDPARTSQANTFAADQTIQSSDGSASAGPNLDLDRASASPAASDALAQLNWKGRSATAVVRVFARIWASVVSASNAAESGLLHLQTIVSGTLADRFLVGSGLYSVAASGGDKGADTVNAKNFYQDGTILPVQQKFVSTDRTITAAGALTIAHGLSAAPALIRLNLIAQGNNDGYSTNDVIELHPGLIDGSNNRGVAVRSDATNVYIQYGSDANSIDMLNGSTGVRFAMTNANYKLRVTAFA